MSIEDAIERIKEATGVKTQTELADLLNVPHQSISIAKKKGRVPDKWLINLCESHNLNPLWIQKGIKPQFIKDTTLENEAPTYNKVEETQAEYKSCEANKVADQEEEGLIVPKLPDPESEKYDWIPMVGAELSAGGGSFIVDERVKDYYAFRKPFITHIATCARNLVLMRVSGDSMDPEIRNGATVMIDLGRKRIKNNCIFALRIEETIVVKELELLAGGSVRIISKNKEYQTYEAESKNINIIGQVIWGDRLYPI